ncbi:MAG: argininosuccinate lyase, partial [Gorillibacterium sp.]|nr:argininosuccinate lyase [Gorillibacterium sp.]
FRQAHEVIGRIVLYCIQKETYLLQLSMDEFREFSDLFDERIYEVLEPEHVVNARNVYGGTARSQVEQALVRAELATAETTKWLEAHITKVVE